MSVAPPGGQNRISTGRRMTAPTSSSSERPSAWSEAPVIRHFQERMPYGLFVSDIP